MSTNDTKDMVVFELPDGTKVSNDPRFDLEEALQSQLDARENKGDVGITDAEQKAQTQVVRVIDEDPEDPTKELHGPTGSPAMRLQKEDLAEAREAGASPKETSVEDPEPVDSNEAVAQARKELAEAREADAKARAALAEADMEPGDPDTPYAEWTGKQLKAEVARRNADGRDPERFIQLKGGMKKSDVAALLDADDNSGQPA